MMTTTVSVLSTIYSPAIGLYFKEPDHPHENLFPVDVDCGDNKEVLANLIDFSRPSDFAKSQQDHLCSGDGPPARNADEFRSNTIPDKWRVLLTAEKIAEEEERQRVYALEHAKKPMRTVLDTKTDAFIEITDWTVANTVVAFELPTSYEAPNQENVLEDEKVYIKLTADSDLSKVTREQLEEVMSGWLDYVNDLVNENRLRHERAEDTPMAEYEYWSRLESLYKGFNEQLRNAPLVLSVVGESCSPITLNRMQSNVEPVCYLNIYRRNSARQGVARHREVAQVHGDAQRMLRARQQQQRLPGHDRRVSAHDPQARGL